MTWILRVGIILTATGLIALALGLAGRGNLSPRTTRISGVGLLVVGLPLLVVGILYRSGVL